MKPANPALTSYLSYVMSAPDAPIAWADLFDLTTLQTGQTFSYTNTDQDIAYNSKIYSSRSILINGLKSKSAVGLEVDRQQITIAARPTDTIGPGAPFLPALSSGAFDGATIVRTRVFMTALGQPPIGGVILFKGRLSTVDQVGRTQAKITVASDLIILDIDMPKNIYSATCLHTLYDAGCTLNAATFSISDVAGAGSTQTVLNFAGAVAFQEQGFLTFTSGANTDIRGTVKTAVPGVSVTMMYPWPEPVAVGDAFTVSQGCNHTVSACEIQFNNLINFRGYPFVPPPQFAF